MKEKSQAKPNVQNSQPKVNPSQKSLNADALELTIVPLSTPLQQFCLTEDPKFDPLFIWPCHPPPPPPTLVGVRWMCEHGMTAGRDGHSPLALARGQTGINSVLAPNIFHSGLNLGTNNWLYSITILEDEVRKKSSKLGRTLPPFAGLISHGLITIYTLQAAV